MPRMKDEGFLVFDLDDFRPLVSGVHLKAV
jgi:hypothetical protein